MGLVACSLYNFPALPPRSCLTVIRLHLSSSGSCLQMRELTMSFSNDIVVGLGLDQEQKAEVTRYFGDFTKNLYSLPVQPPHCPAAVLDVRTSAEI